MADRKQAESALEIIKAFFSDNKKALNHIQGLKRILEGNEDHSILAGNDYPLPNEIKTATAKKAFVLFSDGACRGNPGPGSWGVMAQDQHGAVIFESSGVDMNTTNNKMELGGAIESLVWLDKHLGQNWEGVEVWLYSDSKYVVDGINQWVPGWKKRGWKKADKKAPENLELWQSLDTWSIKLGKALKFIWVKGHSGHPQNERCDRLANLALDEALGK